MEKDVPRGEILSSPKKTARRIHIGYRRRISFLHQWKGKNMKKGWYPLFSSLLIAMALSACGSPTPAVAPTA
jgi:hypothetical protein